MRSIKEKDLYHPVQKVLTSTVLDPAVAYTITSDMRHVIITHVKGEPKILTFVSDYYNLVKNEDVFPVLEKEFHYVFGDIETRCVVDDHARFFVDYILLDKGFKKEHDLVYPSVRISNSYDTGVPFAMSGNCFRVEGSTVVQVVDDTTRKPFYHKFKHTDRNDAKWFVARTKEFLDQYEKMLIQIERLKRFEVHPSRIMLAFEVLKKGTEFPAKSFPRAHEIVLRQAKLLYGNSVNMYLIYHGLAYILNHDHGFKMKEHLRQKTATNLYNNALDMISAKKAGAVAPLVSVPLSVV